MNLVQAKKFPPNDQHNGWKESHTKKHPCEISVQDQKDPTSFQFSLINTFQLQRKPSISWRNIIYNLEFYTKITNAYTMQLN